MLIWNLRDNRSIQGPINQKTLLRVTVSGQPFAFACRIDKQRLIAYRRITCAWPDKNNRTVWKDYFRAIAKGHVPMPENNASFCPTLDWALTKDRFRSFLAIRGELKKSDLI